MALSLKSALLGTIPPEIEQDSDLLNILRTQPSSAVHYLQHRHKCSEEQAIQYANMMKRRVAIRKALMDPRIVLSIKNRKAALASPEERDETVNYVAQVLTNGFRSWAKENHVPVADMSEAFEYYTEQMYEPTTTKPPLSSLSPEDLTAIWGEILRASGKFLIANHGIDILKPKEEGPETKKEVEPEGKWADLPDFEDWVSGMNTLSSDDIIDRYQHLKGLLASRKITKKKFEQCMVRLRELSREVTARVLIGRMARRIAQAQQQSGIVIPPTSDTPTSKNVMLPDRDSPTAPPTDKVAVSPTTPEDKKETVDESIDDSQKTRQEQLANSFRALEVCFQI